MATQSVCITNQCHWICVHTKWNESRAQRTNQAVETQSTILATQRFVARIMWSPVAGYSTRFHQNGLPACSQYNNNSIDELVAENTIETDRLCTEQLRTDFKSKIAIIKKKKKKKKAGQSIQWANETHAPLLFFHLSKRLGSKSNIYHNLRLSWPGEIEEQQRCNQLSMTVDLMALNVRECVGPESHSATVGSRPRHRRETHRSGSR